jgi:hypothetical protein
LRGRLDGLGAVVEPTESRNATPTRPPPSAQAQSVLPLSARAQPVPYYSPLPRSRPSSDDNNELPIVSAIAAGKQRVLTPSSVLHEEQTQAHRKITVQYSDGSIADDLTDNENAILPNGV